MTIKDLQCEFTWSGTPNTASFSPSFSIVGPAQAFFCPNGYDTGVNASFLTALSANDTLLQANGFYYFRDQGAGSTFKFCCDWVSGVSGAADATVQTQLVTSPFSTILNPAAPLYRPPVVITTSDTISAGACAAFLALDLESDVLGYADGFAIK